MNGIWETGDLPSIWKLANVIPIPKPGKDHAEPSNYRPIALTSCVFKTMERQITSGSAPILFQCSSSFRPEDAKIAEVVRCWMFSEPSFGLFAIFDGIFALVIKPWFSWVFWICRGLWYSLISQ
jgi:potassium voltage-gated channel Eag-related subfamily H protein 8